MFPTVFRHMAAGIPRRMSYNPALMRRLWAFGRFTLFVALYVLAGKGLDRILPLIHFPEGSFTWRGILANTLLDFACAVLLAWMMALIFRERFSSYGMPFVHDAGKLMLKGAIWGFIPSALILIPIFAAGACSWHGLALHGRDL